MAEKKEYLPADRYDTLRLAEGMRLILRGFSIILAEVGDYAVRAALDTAAPNEEIEKLMAEDIQKESDPLSEKLKGGDVTTGGNDTTANPPAEQSKPVSKSMPADVTGKEEETRQAKQSETADEEINHPAPKEKQAQLIREISEKVKASEKANPGDNELSDRIYQLVKSYGVNSVREIPEAKYDEFREKLKEIR